MPAILNLALVKYWQTLDAMRDLRANDSDMITIGQYLQSNRHHLPVERFVHPDEFRTYQTEGYAMRFEHVASGPLVRSW